MRSTTDDGVGPTRRGDSKLYSSLFFPYCFFVWVEIYRRQAEFPRNLWYDYENGFWAGDTTRWAAGF